MLKDLQQQLSRPSPWGVVALQSPLRKIKKEMRPSRALVFTHLLSYDEYLPRLPLEAWTQKLEHLLSPYVSYVDVIAAPELFVSVLNQAALVLSLVGELEESKALCIRLIDFYGFLAKDQGQIEFYEHSLQAWINIGRLERLQGQLDRALACFSVFEEGVLLSAASVVHRGIAQARLRRGKSLGVIRFCAFIEPLKTYLLQKDYVGVERILNQEKDYYKDSKKILFFGAEAKMMSLFVQGAYQEAETLLLSLYSRVPAAYLPVFSLRLAELYYGAREEILAREEMQKLFSYVIAQGKMAIEHRLHALIFMMPLLRLGRLLKMDEILIHLLEMCFPWLEALQDEVLSMACLSHLFELKGGGYEEDFKRRVQASHYAAVRQQYPQFCAEKKSDFYQPLLQKLDLLLNRRE